MLFKKMLLGLSMVFVFSSSAMADAIIFENLDRVSPKIKHIPISEGFDLSKAKDILDIKQENRFTGKGMKRSFYMGTIFHHKLKKWNIPLFNNWYIDNLKNNGCFKPSLLTLNKFRTTRKEQLGFNVWDDSKFCIINDKIPYVYSVVYLNGRYVAITTNINIFIFDTEKGKFLNDYLVTNGKVVQFFITEDQEIAVKANKDNIAYDGTLRYWRNGDKSLYQDLTEADQIFLERLMIFYSDPQNLQKPENWKLSDFQKMLFDK